MPEYKVKQGDCVSSIAERYGLSWEKIWNHPNNAELNQKREDPNVLYSGDVVFIPEKEVKQESGATGQRHHFRRKGVPEKLIIVLKEEDEPRVNVPYILEIDGELLSGSTDSEGRLEHPISPDAKRGKLIIGEGEDREEQDLQLGHLDPITEISGIQARLDNLGFECGQINGKLGPETQEAIRLFQTKHGLNVTGEPYEAMRQKLKEEYGT
jgi:hypothetical protein